MKYDDLFRILEEEEKKSTLSRIPQDFYKELYEYIRELEAAERTISRRHSEEAIMIQYELKNALTVIDKIFNKRIRKIIKMATGKAFSKNPSNIGHDIDNMTPDERNIYHQVLDAILMGKKNTIEPVLGNGSENEPGSITQLQDVDKSVSPPEAVKTSPSTPLAPVELSDISDQELSSPEKEATKILPPDYIPPADDAPQSYEGDTTSSVELTSAPEDTKTTDSDEKGKKDLNKEYILVRILKDISTFAGSDGRNYSLSAQDVAILPKVNAKALIKRKIAVQIKST